MTTLDPNAVFDMLMLNGSPFRDTSTSGRYHRAQHAPSVEESPDQPGQPFSNVQYLLATDRRHLPCRGTSGQWCAHHGAQCPGGVASPPLLPEVGEGTDEPENRESVVAETTEIGAMRLPHCGAP